MRSQLLRIGRLVAGTLLVLLGIAGLVLPVLQGLLLIAAGLGVLSVDVPVLKRWRVRLLRKLRDRRRRH